MTENIISPNVRIGLKVLGVWPGWSSSVGFLLVVGSLALNLTFQLWDAMLLLRNLDAVMANLGATTAILASLLKLVSLRMKRRSAEALINEMYNDWSSESKRQDCDVMPKHVRRACTLTNCLVVAYNSIMITTSLNTIVAYASGVLEKRVFIVPANFPPACKHSPLFEIVCCCQLTALFMSVNGHVIIEGLLVALVLHASTKVNIIQREINEFSEICRSSDSSKITLEAFRGFLKKHLNYIEFVDKIKDIYAYVSFFHVFMFTLTHVIVGYTFMDTLERGERSIKLFLYGLFTVRSLLSTMIHCVAGEYLTNQSKKIFEDLCNCSWYQFHVRDMKAMTFIIMRSRSPMCLVTAKINNLSLNYLTSIIKTSFSFFSLARAVRHKID